MLSRKTVTLYVFTFIHCRFLELWFGNTLESIKWKSEVKSDLNSVSATVTAVSGPSVSAVVSVTAITGLQLRRHFRNQKKWFRSVSKVKHQTSWRISPLHRWRSRQRSRACPESGTSNGDQWGTGDERYRSARFSRPLCVSSHSSLARATCSTPSLHTAAHRPCDEPVIPAAAIFSENLKCS